MPSVVANIANFVGGPSALAATKFFCGTRRNKPRYREHPTESARLAPSVGLPAPGFPLPWLGRGPSLGWRPWPPLYSTGPVPPASPARLDWKAFPGQEESSFCTYTYHVQVLDAPARRKFQLFCKPANPLKNKAYWFGLGAPGRGAAHKALECWGFLRRFFVYHAGPAKPVLPGFLEHGPNLTKALGQTST